jgi:hypothetical protein
MCYITFFHYSHRGRISDEDDPQENEKHEKNKQEHKNENDEYE